MPRKSKRPAKVVVHPVHARVVRGPDADGRWYWQGRIFEGEGGGDRTVLSGWYRRPALIAAIHELIKHDGLDQPTEPAAEVRTVQDLLEAWLGSRADAADLEAATKRASRSSAQRLVGPADGRTALGSVLLRHLDKRHLEHYRDTVGGAESTVARDLKTLRSAWRWGRDIGHVPDRTLPSLRRPGKTRAAKAVYTRYTPTEPEVAQVIEKIRRPWAKRAVILLYATGGRIGEIATLRWGAVAPYWRELPMRGDERLCDVEGLDLHWTALDAASVVLDGKTGPREVQLHPDVAAELASWRPDDAQPEDGVWGVTPATATTRIQAELAQASEALGLPRLSPNGLRRAAERALYRTREVDVAASIMGHSPETAIRTYRAVTAEERARVVAEAGLSIPRTRGAGEVVQLFIAKEE